MEEPLRGRHCEQRRDLTASARLTEDRDVAWVAAELGDVGSDPLERVHDVEHAGVARLREVAAAELREIGEAEHVQAVVDRNHHDVAAAREVGAVGHGRRTGARDEPTAVAPDHHRPLTAVADRRRPDVEHQAVLALGRQIRRRYAEP